MREYDKGGALPMPADQQPGGGQDPDDGKHDPDILVYKTYSGGHIVHGCANAMYLPKVIRFNAREKEAAERYADIARHLRLAGDTAAELVDSLIAHIEGLNRALDIPPRIKDYEGGIIAEQEFLEKLPRVAELAVGDACTGSNPRAITPAQMEKLLLCCYYGTEVDF